MATLATQVVPDAGLLNPTLGAASGGGDKCATGSGVLLLVKNADAASHTATLATPQTVDGLAVTDRAIVVPASDTAYIPVPDLYKDPSDGLAHITYDAVTSVTVGVIRVA